MIQHSAIAAQRVYLFRQSIPAIPLKRRHAARYMVISHSGLTSTPPESVRCILWMNKKKSPVTGLKVDPMRPLESPASPISFNSISRNIGNVYSNKPAMLKHPGRGRADGRTSREVAIRKTDRRTARTNSSESDRRRSGTWRDSHHVCSSEQRAPDNASRVCRSYRD